MEEYFSYFDKDTKVAFATVHNNTPRLRILKVMRREGEKIYFATSPNKHLVRDLKANARVEVIAIQRDVSVKVVGDVNFDVPKEVQKEIYDSNPLIEKMFGSIDGVVYFTIDVMALDYFNNEPQPAVAKHFDLRDGKDSE